MKNKLISLYQKYKELIRYVIVGGLTTLVSLGTYYLCTVTFLDPNKQLNIQIATVLSWIAAVTFSYFASRAYVFQSKNRHILAEAVSFYLSRGGTLLVDMGLMAFGTGVLKINDRIMKLIVQIVVMILNYVLGKLVVFRKKKETLKGENPLETQQDTI